MIIGAHSVIRSTNPDADRAFLRDVLKLTSVDDGGYLIFGLPPAEVSVHLSDKNDVHQFYLICGDIKAFVSDMERHHISCGPVEDEGWGLVTQVTLPGGGKLTVYEPRHARPRAMSAKAVATKAASSRGTKARQRLPKARVRAKAK
jgi:hypothetical protein